MAKGKTNKQNENNYIAKIDYNQLTKAIVRANEEIKSAKREIKKNKKNMKKNVGIVL